MEGLRFTGHLLVRLCRTRSIGRTPDEENLSSWKADGRKGFPDRLKACEFCMLAPVAIGVFLFQLIFYLIQFFLKLLLAVRGVT